MSWRGITNEGHVHVVYDAGPIDRRSFLRQAAEDGHVAAMYEYGLQCDDPDEQRRWLRKAAQQGYVPTTGPSRWAR